MITAVAVLLVLLAVVGYIGWKASRKVRELSDRYSPIIDLDKRLQAAKANLEAAKREQQTVASDNQQRRAKLEKEFQEALANYDSLKKEIALLEENLEDISFGFYKPHFTFQTSEEYKTALELLRDRERDIIRSGAAAICRTEWAINSASTANEAKRQGARMTKQYLKLLLRGFNAECDAAVANVAWNNIQKMEQRVRKAYEALNDLGTVMQMSIMPQYLNLKIDELRLTHELEEKKQQEKEEQRRIRERIRDEEKAQKEIEKAREEAEEEEATYEKALSKAREETLKATGAQLDKLTEQVKALEGKLDEARAIKERAISRAQLTRSGFVYVISNIGSFGDKVLKVGMTRRLEPMDRIAELGDASVPFPFDLHAMIYCDDAPSLETALHEFLDSRRVNLVNPRKEFYQHVEFAEIETFIKQKGLSAQFIRLPEAKEFRETLALQQQQTAQAEMPLQAEQPKFARALFASSGQ
jgi:hypothetical protein